MGLKPKKKLDAYRWGIRQRLQHRAWETEVIHDHEVVDAVQNHVVIISAGEPNSID